MVELLFGLALILKNTLCAFFAVSEYVFVNTWPVVIPLKTIVCLSSFAMTTVVVCEYYHGML